MRRRARLLIVFIPLLLQSAAGAQVAGRLTNLELTQRALDDAAGRVLEGLPPLDPRRLILREEGESEGGWMVESTLAQHLKRRGWEVVLDEPLTSPDAGGVVSYRVIDLGVVYGRKHRKGILGKSFVERHARAELSILLTKLPSGDVLWVDQVRGEARDEVSEDELKVLKGDSFTLNPEELKKENRSLLEPMIVTALVGVLIYLFYSTKSTQ